LSPTGLAFGRFWNEKTIFFAIFPYFPGISAARGEFLEISALTASLAGGGQTRRFALKGDASRGFSRLNWRKGCRLGAKGRLKAKSLNLAAWEKAFQKSRK
jgi:hypothetical protein